MGLVFFTLVNAGVTVGSSGIGYNALLIFLSLFLGKLIGVVGFYRVRKGGSLGLRVVLKYFIFMDVGIRVED